MQHRPVHQGIQHPLLLRTSISTPVSFHCLRPYRWGWLWYCVWLCFLAELCSSAWTPIKRQTSFNRKSFPALPLHHLLQVINRILSPNTSSRRSHNLAKLVAELLGEELISGALLPRRIVGILDSWNKRTLELFCRGNHIVLPILLLEPADFVRVGESQVSIPLVNVLPT